MEKELLTFLIIMTAFSFAVLLLKTVNRDRLLVAKRLAKMIPDAAPGKIRIRKERKKKKKETRGVLVKLESLITAAGLLIWPSEFLILWGLSAFVPALLFFSLSRSITVSLGTLISGLILPPFILFRKKTKRTELLEKQLVEAVGIIANSLKSGLTFQQAMVSISQDMPDPISKEFARIVREINLGNSVEKALTNAAERLGSNNFMMIVSAILIQRQIGGNLSDILTNIAGTIKERFRIKNEIRVLTTTGRTSGKVIGLLPIFILLFFMIANPAYVEGFFHTTIGILMLSIGAVLEIIGFLVIHRIVSIKY